MKKSMKDSIITNLWIILLEYVKYLYNNFDDDRLVVIWYFMWLDNLKILMMEQSQTDFEKLYFPPNILEKYYDYGLRLYL